MKKLIALTVLAVAGVAFASSLSVPWFADNSPTNTGLPPASGTMTLVYLHNNLPTVLTAKITYFTQDGGLLGPATNNTFTIPARATIAFRPCVDDANDSRNLDPLGAETPTGKLVPNRPSNPDLPGGAKKNGSLIVEWLGNSGDVQGMLLMSQNADNSATGRLAHMGTLLPPGV